MRCRNCNASNIADDYGYYKLWCTGCELGTVGCGRRACVVDCLRSRESGVTGTTSRRSAPSRVSGRRRSAPIVAASCLACWPLTTAPRAARPPTSAPSAGDDVLLTVCITPWRICVYVKPLSRVAYVSVNELIPDRQTTVQMKM